MNRPFLFLLGAFAGTIALYWPGLSGGLFLDDNANLEPVWRWLDGEITWIQVVFENRSGPLGRPLSLLSFVGTASLFGDSIFAFKAVNLSIHVLIGVFIYLFLEKLFTRDRVVKEYSAWVAFAIATVWLLHPMFVSTVLYVVQRMAMLSTLFVVIGLWAYLQGRSNIQAGRMRLGVAWLFLGIPLLTFLAAFSKETGLLLPLLCGVLEWAYFSPTKGNRREPAVRWFISAFVFTPIILGSLYLATHPSFFLLGYENRPFSLTERLLTQTRVLFDYVGSLLLPVGQEFSLYRDDYLVSTGPFSPLTTAAAIVGWGAILGLSFALRKMIPGFAAGVGIFLVGHLMESSIFPLLIYFEHRNYLPGLGILVAVASLLAYAGQAASARMDRPSIIFGGAVVGLFLALSFATFARSLAWQSPTHLLEQAVAQYPDSRFARMELAAFAMNEGPIPDYPAAVEHYRHLQGLELPSTRAIGYVGEMAVSCFALGRTDSDNLFEAFSQQPETIQADYLKAVEELGRILRMRDCEGISMSEYAKQLAAVADGTHLSQGVRTVWRLRFEAARLYVADERDREALQQARLAWHTGNADLPVAMMMAGLHIRQGEFGAAKRMLDKISPMIPDGDESGQALLARYRDAIEEGSRNSIIARDLDG